MNDFDLFKLLNFMREADDTKMANLLIRVASKHPEIVVDILDTVHKEENVKILNTASNDQLNPIKFIDVNNNAMDITTEIMYHIRRKDGYSDKVAAVKDIRQLFGIGLKEAKDIVEDDNFWRHVYGHYYVPHWKMIQTTNHAQY